ncbi:tyrosine recombinase XerC [Streptomyces sp. NBRC 110028]|uniref:site-specific integrase n=1 Tax=Streptomyces sp. NBRC 110028 TaxID=1621260 RepID=UPI000A735FA1|nr:site-specific integrase [Streptomyces sp. NBRC 110028]
MPRLRLTPTRGQCQCCAQGKDARREEPRCCAVGRCCDRVPSRRTVQDARAVLRSSLTNAMTEELISKNVAGLVKVRSARKVKRDPWSVEEVRKFLEAASAARDPLYAAWVLILLLGFRRGEVLGLTWQGVNLDAGEVTVQLQLQRIRRRLVHDETKTEASTATLPLPDICVAALRARRKEQEAAKQTAGELWTDSNFVFTTRYGTPIEPRNFNRSFADRSSKAGIRRIRLHDTLHTCGSLLAALDVHPRIAMQILRHSKIAVTMEIYTHVPSEATRKALRRLGKHLGKQDRK